MVCINSNPSVQCLANVSGISVIDQNRRTANYKPNIWQYDLLEALTTEYAHKKYEKRFNELIEEVKGMFFDTADTLANLELIDNIQKLGLACLFEHEIVEALDFVASNRNPSIEKDLYASALLFTLLRQQGYQVSQDMFIGFMDSSRELMEIGTKSDVKAMLKLFEASHLALESENILDELKEIARRNLKNVSSKLDDASLAKTVSHTLQLPYRLEWYNVKRQICYHEKDTNTKSLSLNRLAKLNFNMVQATHQKELKEISRWWRNLGIAESFTFTRNRIVESYLWAVGVAFEPQNGSLRKWLAKAIKLVLVIDDVYDVYGTLQELEHFTSAVDSWDAEGTQNLPECMKICFQTLYDTTNEIAYEIQKEKGWDSVLPHLQEVWADFCKALLVEAKWYNKSYTPSLQEHLDNGWISSSGPILSLHSLFSVTHGLAGEAFELLESTHDLVYNASLIIRLCNDLGTSAAELERGDAPSSILCLMREKNVSEEVARVHIRSLITNSWKKINYGCAMQSPLLQPFVKCIKNTARVAEFIYQNGDGFGVPDHETRDHVLSLLMEPLPLN